MRLGYSILLGELVQAERLAWKDCETWQVTCPICHEPVFKAVRQLGEDLATHYLSHYRASTADVADCELRVAHVTQEEIELRASLSRQQRLAYFLSVLKDQFDYTVFAEDSAVRAEISQYAKSKALVLMADSVRDEVKGYDLDFIKHLISVKKQVAIYGMENDCDAQIVYDIIKMICARASNPLFMHIYLGTYVNKIYSMERTIEKYGHDPDGYMQPSIRWLRSAARPGNEGLLALKMLELNTNWTIGGRRRANLLDHNFGHVAGHMVMLLASLPYREMLIERFGRADWPTSARAVVPQGGETHALT